MSTRSERTVDKALNEKHSKILKDLMKRPENRKCVDCRKRDPRWAAWNLGIFMCIRCSGVHRSLGVHISKVKSADLDSWTPEQVENMIRWGNYKANIYWEKDWPADMDPPESNIEQWIRAKYERKQYAMKSALPDPDTLPGFGSGGVVSPSAGTGKAGNAVPSEKASNNNLISVGQATAAAPASTNASASQQLFAAFGSAPSTTTASTAPKTNPQDDLKKNILSLYNSGPSTANVTGGVAGAASSGFSAFSAPAGNSIGGQPSQITPPTVPAAFASFASFSPPQPQAKPPSSQNSFAAFSSSATTSTVSGATSAQNDLLGVFSSMSVNPSSRPSTSNPVSTGLSALPAASTKSTANDVFGDFVTPAIQSSLPTSSLASNGIGLTTSTSKSNSLLDTFGDFVKPAPSSAPGFSPVNGISSFSALTPTSSTTNHFSSTTTPAVPVAAATSAASDFDGFGDFTSVTTNNTASTTVSGAGRVDSFGDFKVGLASTSTNPPVSPLTQQTSSQGLGGGFDMNPVKPVSAVPAFKGFDDHNVWN